jgi:RNA recognition motif-containing protein
VEVASPEEAESAIKRFHNFNLNGRTIVVSEARARPEGGGRGQARR